MSASRISIIITIVFVFTVVITILSILLLIIVRVRSHNDSLACPSFARFPRSKDSLEDELTVFVSPSRPTVVGRTSAKGYPVIHVTITPPTPARVPSDLTGTNLNSR
ncbi:hypothetical protein M405DRAFT_816340 [Rhizopogon salebrosus TDB-379]|nr:hypothetical protein M405DRAFT_816340 [Rhizopogon salebrosus TDB-379]